MPAAASTATRKPAVAWRPLLTAAAVIAALLLATASGYGWHRDELYFRMLDPAWGYVDQPPLLPWLGRTLGSSLVLLRLSAIACAAGSVIVVALIARELGACARAQAWCAWSYAGTAAVLGFGHVLLTSSVDLLAWSLISLLVARALLLKADHLWWAAGVVAGAASYAKLLVVVLLVGIVLGLALVGPRSALRKTSLWGGGLVALLVAAPNVLYQVRHDWPQLAMGRALSENNAGETRWFMWVFLIVILGPVLVPIWGRGLIALWRRPDWRPVRCFVIVPALLVAFTFGSGAQPHYPLFGLFVPLAAGFAVRPDGPRRAFGWAVAVNAAVAVLVSVPVLPLRWLGLTPIPGMSSLVADTVGWPTYAEQIEQVWSALPPADRAQGVVLASNYGEAGALARFAPQLPVVSGHNALADQTAPPADTEVVVVVGGQFPSVAPFFARCELRAELENGVGVDNEEQGQPVAVCRAPLAPWATLWPRVRHLD